MVFSDPVFMFFFLPLVLLGSFLAPKIIQNFTLLAFSLAFYSWGEKFYVLLMITSIGLNYIIGLMIDQRNSKNSSLLVLQVGIACNLLLLGAFKYANFFADILNDIFSPFGIQEIDLAPVHLPIGISFFTFQAISYIIDVYRKNAPLQRNIVDLALYIALFPQLIAGPIVRYLDVAEQIVKRTVSFSLFTEGVARFIVGLGKKVILANTFAYPADQIFSSPASEITLITAWFGIICYMLQLYYDFSGYSDMAIGLGKMFGFRFLENFNYPFISRSISEFWTRWHISLANWFRDYVYIPLGGNRCSELRSSFNLFAIFFLSGLWHGAAWTFVIWGVYQGVFVVIERLKVSKKLLSLLNPPILIRHIYGLFVITMGMVIFRSESMEYSIQYWARMLGQGGFNFDIAPIRAYLHADFNLLFILAIAGLTPVLPSTQKLIRNTFNSRNSEILIQFSQAAALSLIFGYCLLQIASNSYSPFIYFRF